MRPLSAPSIVRRALFLYGLPRLFNAVPFSIAMRNRSRASSTVMLRVETDRRFFSASRISSCQARPSDGVRKVGELTDRRRVGSHTRAT